VICCLERQLDAVRKTVQTSTAQRLTANSLAQLRVPCREELMTPEGFLIDVAVLPQDWREDSQGDDEIPGVRDFGRPIAVENDGPTHFVTAYGSPSSFRQPVPSSLTMPRAADAQLQYGGNALLKQWLLREHGWTVVPISHLELSEETNQPIDIVRKKLRVAVTEG